jgi:hypothetical protein
MELPAGMLGRGSFCMETEQWAADADLARELTHVIASIRFQRRDDPQPVRGERRQHREVVTSC